MSELAWSDDVPKTGGFYWYWEKGGQTFDGEPIILYVVSDPPYHLLAYPPAEEFYPFMVDELRGQWAGPLEPPR